jgi:cytochrome P450 / NADPH-cytochrome P450 reductase
VRTIISSVSIDLAGIPHPPWRVPFLGDVLGVSPSRLISDSVRFSRELGPIFYRKFLGTEVVFVCGADLVAELSDENRFAKHLAPALERLRVLAGDGLVTACNEEPNWHLAHDILQTAFSSQAMRVYHEVMVAVVRRLIAQWDGYAGTAPVDVVDDTARLTLDIIGLAGFDYDFASFERTDLHPAAQALRRALVHFQASPRNIPPLDKILGRTVPRRMLADKELMTEFINAVISERTVNHAGRPTDMLSVMLNGRDQETGASLSEANIRNQVLTLLIAAHETTTSAISFSLYYLLKNPRVLARAQNDVDAIWPARSVPQPAFEDVAKLRYIRQVVHEALRLSPPAPVYARKARADTVLGGRYPIQKDQSVIVLIPALHRDPVWGADTEAFDPERFRPVAVRARPPHAFKAFGTGPRSCIGRQFALHEVTLTLAMLIHRYLLLDPPGGYRLRIRESVTVRPAGFTLGLARRD